MMESWSSARRFPPVWTHLTFPLPKRIFQDHNARPSECPDSAGRSMKNSTLERCFFSLKAFLPPDRCSKRCRHTLLHFSLRSRYDSMPRSRWFSLFLSFWSSESKEAWYHFSEFLITQIRIPEYSSMTHRNCAEINCEEISFALKSTVSPLLATALNGVSCENQRIKTFFRFPVSAYDADFSIPELTSNEV